MEKQLLNSPTDGNGTTSSNMTTRNMVANTMPVRQSLCGPDATANNANQGIQRNVPQSMQRSMPQRDCGCGNKNNKPVNQPPAPNWQPQMPAKQISSPTRQNINQAKNYYNKAAAKYPQQNQ